MGRPEQNYSNHVRLDPAFHFFLVPVAVFTLIAAVVREIRTPSWWNAWSIVAALGAGVAVVLIRTYALKVQDRVIRLEQRLRLQELAGGLTERQLIALRFASDGEVAELSRRAAAENLSPKQIKQAVRIWKPDYFRV